MVGAGGLEPPTYGLRVGRIRNATFLLSLIQINNLPPTKPARKHFAPVLTRLTLAHSGPKRTAHLRHTILGVPLLGAVEPSNQANGVVHLSRPTGRPDLRMRELSMAPSGLGSGSKSCGCIPVMRYLFLASSTIREVDLDHDCRSTDGRIVNIRFRRALNSCVSRPSGVREVCLSCDPRIAYASQSWPNHRTRLLRMLIRISLAANAPESGISVRGWALVRGISIGKIC